jgi:hypothetical protein
MISFDKEEACMRCSEDMVVIFLMSVVKDRAVIEDVSLERESEATRAHMISRQLVSCECQCLTPGA